MSKTRTIDGKSSESSHAEMRTSGQLALFGGAYACKNGCGAVLLVGVHRPLPWCPRCQRRTSWLRQRDGALEP